MLWKNKYVRHCLHCLILLLRYLVAWKPFSLKPSRPSACLIKVYVGPILLFSSPIHSSSTGGKQPKKGNVGAESRLTSCLYNECRAKLVICVAPNLSRGQRVSAKGMPVRGSCEFQTSFPCVLPSISLLIFIVWRKFLITQTLWPNSHTANQQA